MSKWDKSTLNKSLMENTNLFVEFRSPKKIFKTNIKKMYVDKVLKIKDEAHFDEQSLNLDGKQMHNLFFRINSFFGEV